MMNIEAEVALAQHTFERSQERGGTWAPQFGLYHDRDLQTVIAIPLDGIERWTAASAAGLYAGATGANRVSFVSDPEVAGRKYQIDALVMWVVTLSQAAGVLLPYLAMGTEVVWDEPAFIDEPDMAIIIPLLAGLRTEADATEVEELIGSLGGEVVNL